MLFNAGELTLIEYGNNEPVGFCRTEHVSPHLISVRIHEKKNENGETIECKKVIAYLLDLQVFNYIIFIWLSNMIRQYTSWTLHQETLWQAWCTNPRLIGWN
jgi:hypothetical protein